MTNPNPKSPNDNISMDHTFDIIREESMSMNNIRSRENKRIYLSGARQSERIYRRIVK